MEKTEKTERMSKRRQVFLTFVGLIALFLDKLEGKPAAPGPATTGRIEIVDG
jgi:hypothetical protein